MFRRLKLEIIMQKTDIGGDKITIAPSAITDGAGGYSTSLRQQLSPGGRQMTLQLMLDFGFMALPEQT